MPKVGANARVRHGVAGALRPEHRGPRQGEQACRCRELRMDRQRAVLTPPLSAATRGPNRNTGQKAERLDSERAGEHTRQAVNTRVVLRTLECVASARDC
eukprot:4543172-Prymnesium_polylepis.2